MTTMSIRDDPNPARGGKLSFGASAILAGPLRRLGVAMLLAQLVATAGARDSPNNPVVLPIEVIGPNGTTETVTVDVPAHRRVTALWMEIHGLTFPGKASVQVNDEGWVPLNNDTVEVAQPGRSFGGIGGGFATLKMTLSLKAHAVHEGPNQVRFRLHDVTRSSISFRVLRFNFLARGEKVLPDSAFSEEDPRTWRPPIDDPSAIAEGRRLWYDAELRDRGRAIQARCTDCHAHDGRDLKYFNYSNHSIIERAKFHGLDDLQGRQIASYIRSLDVPYAPMGRPWNPPYQPGPGLDSKPVREWAAGAGLEWVLDKDEKTLEYIFPDGITSDAIPFDGMLNAREIPVAIQYPDWNHWLPEVHPKDAWGKTFSDSEFARRYSKIRGAMKEDRAASARTLKAESHAWYLDAVEFFGRSGHPAVPIPPRPWSREFQIQYNAAVHWRITKFWEIITEWGLEDMGRVVLGPWANERTWYDSMIFNTAPHLLKLEWHTNPINDGSAHNWHYFSAAWYQLQVTLNNANKQPYGTDPIDWPYLHAFAGGLASKDVGSAGILTLDLVTAAQAVGGGKSPRLWNRGWDPTYRANAHLLAPDPHWPNVWRQVSKETHRKVVEAYLKNWIDRTDAFPPVDYYRSDEPKMNGAFARPDERVQPRSLDAMGGRWLDRFWAMVVNFRKLGVDPTLIDRVVDFGSRIWPHNDWNSLRSVPNSTANSKRPHPDRVAELR